MKVGEEERLELDRPKGDYHSTLKSFRKARPKGAAAKARHAWDALAAVMLAPEKAKLVYEWGWGKVMKALLCSQRGSPRGIDRWTP